ncbi:general transcription factor 3C polypeptide 5 [Culicoides brevitarsis]|uniref:general transcription factor 3C polypeptide 5 n=1 Tax=Culicoides brevitarsis TaxID=469753 RepID=UPI00307BF897
MEYPGDDPSAHNIEKLLVCVDYPGKVLNPEKAIATLGGIDEVSKTFNNEKKHLEVRFNPENVYCRKATGEKVSGTGMLVKVRVKKNPKTGTKEVKEASIMGITQETHQFNNLMDYNYIPLQKVKGNLECIYNNIVPSGILPSSYIEENKNVPLFLPPPVFSRIEIPQTGLFKKIEAGTSDTTTSKDENVIGVNRSRRKNYATCMRFTMTEPIPAKPHNSAFDSITLKVVSQEKIDAVKETFKTRPIWTRLGLIENSKVSAVDVKTILPIVAYYYSSGPWRPCWVRFGYDPREHFEARKYQPIDFRYKGISVTKRESKTKESVDGNASIFTEETIPDTKLTFYQYCDVQVPKIQEMLENMTSHGVKCDEKRGWLPQGFQDECREIMGEIVKNNFMRVYQREYIDYESTIADDDLDDGDEDMEEEEDLPESEKMED